MAEILFGWVGGIALRFFTHSCSKRAFEGEFAPPNPRMYAASLLIRVFGSRSEPNKKPITWIDSLFGWDGGMNASLLPAQLSRSKLLRELLVIERPESISSTDYSWVIILQPQA